ncbi:hypothetical protein DEU34_0787 [Microbacterium sp. AG1240]|uniref:FtsX-like permease family protein n=1 Tax=Microbacterium sp. AG1240 TaxID=2183992 RepID=UPI000EACAC94|nr:FtsX-like permease family protein [Microbacterium sp. AG1240]RKT36275.1 hypothetical protein DEU34_0787 [Microbacterium sp. AG1240]
MTRLVSARLFRRRIAPHIAPLVLTAVLIAALVVGVVGLPRALAVSNDEQFAAALDPNRSSASEITLSGEWAEADGGGLLARSLARAAEEFPARLREPLAGATGQATTNIVLAGLLLDQTGADGDDPVRVRLGVDAQALSSARTIEGAAPATWTGVGPLEIALVDSAASRMGVAVGDRLSSAGLEMIVAEVVEPAPGDAVALRHREVFDDITEERLQSGTAVLGIGALIDPASLDALDGFVFGAQFSAWYPVSSAGLEASDIGELTSAIRSAMSSGAALQSGQPLSVNSRLPPILDRVVTTSANTSALAWLLAAGVLGAVVVAVGNALRSFADRRAVGRALLSARGASVGRTIRDAAMETAVAAVPGAAIGVAVAVVALPGPVGPGDIGSAAIVALAAILWGAVRAAPLPPAWRGSVRVGGDLLVLALGAGAAALLAVRGFAPSDAGADPFLVSAPAWIAIAAGVLAGRILPYGLRAIERVRRNGASAGAGVARAWATRRPAAVAPLVAIVVALSACVSSLIAGQALADTLTTVARDAVGADARIVSVSGAGAALGDVRAVPGVADAVEVRVARGVGLTDDGRSRSADVLVTDTAALHALRPDLPVLQPGEIAVGPELAGGVDGTLEIGDDIPVDARVVSARLPASDEGRWVLVDERTLAGEALSGPVWVLCSFAADAPADTPAGLRAIAGDDATVTVADEVRAEAAARPSAVVLTGVLWAGAVVPLGLAALALFAAVVAVGPERERLRAVLRLLGMPPRGGALPVLWQVVPVVVAGSLVGAVVGIAVSSLVAAATDVAGIAGVTATAAGSAFPVLAVALATTGGMSILIAAGMVAALPGLRRARRVPARNGAS